ncbi:MAG: radical SAM protein [Candidatus Woesearchaeota archaeon]
MQAYIANLNEELNLEKIKDKAYIVYFSGNDYQNDNFKEFKSENLILLKDLKKEIENNVDFLDTIIFSGGNPCLQRLALLDLCRFAKIKKLKTILFTNGTKPETIRSLIKEDLIDEINLNLNSPFNHLFDKITKSSTFFKQSDEIIEDIKKSIELINKNKIKFNIITKLNKEILIEKKNLLLIAKIVNENNANWKIEKNGHSDRLIETIKDMCKEMNLNFIDEF